MKTLLLKFLKTYHQYFSLPGCRFQPTCSEYTYQAIEKYGILLGSWKGLRRIFRCHPWSKGGLDPLI
ncbi:membrane protein insertion efficiency factor YidD [Candidatus Shapirobacteria bacterium CG08_land_8_20_14_0_20_39_18]|uniref:Putative membrane protein insertion efficiency factor n=1 Tax=Candidatus Shapirobacteria bacterium CG08_land_8_20_14_0_20_39_18 TaxID=1974883 RepID=A0A2M6XCU2_9BACT|nr:MAG: membrane protein insertion efficiency factor YidD [Candidatus Shapirobacteria bacterium CG08_land_8_20_14_0_20_39_18]PIY65098.1 MAG: membrane protein insertion efficiency factor YidD [Candidatus Shapirobacteria bacterium CG_4_10_14_0_8_um_filter_39_15]PJE68183.1 MAG: membrane protein insertion efficiency factor YidD [Candidatus Shapirobacteria bacterium CG10_big_fil_rev_8_21_14_0_10_38_8]